MALRLIVRALRSWIARKRAQRSEEHDQEHSQEHGQEPSPHDLRRQNTAAVVQGLSHATWRSPHALSNRIVPKDELRATTPAAPKAGLPQVRPPQGRALLKGDDEDRFMPAPEWTRARTDPVADEAEASSPQPVLSPQAQSPRYQVGEVSGRQEGEVSLLVAARAHDSAYRDHVEFCFVMDRIMAEAARRQTRLNTTCDQTSFTYLHLLLFNSVGSLNLAHFHASALSLVPVEPQTSHLCIPCFTPVHSLLHTRATTPYRWSS